MARQLIFVPPGWVTGTQAIGPGYTKGSTPAQMRGWAGNLNTLNRVIDEDKALPPAQQRLNVWQQLPPDQRPPVAHELVELQRTLNDPGSGIRGDLGPGDRVELAGGAHRAHYIAERGDTPV